MSDSDHRSILTIRYVEGTLDVRDKYTVDATTKRLLARLDEIDEERRKLRAERDAITTALSVAGVRPSRASQRMYTHEESEYSLEQPFTNMSLTDACLKVLKDHPSEWLSKVQVEYLVARGGFPFATEDPLNSVNVTLRRLAADGLCDVHKGKGTRGSKYKFLRNREDDLKDTRTTK